MILIQQMTATTAGNTADAAPKDDRAVTTGALRTIPATPVHHIIQGRCAKEGATRNLCIIITIHICVRALHTTDAKVLTRDDLKIA